MKAFNFRLWHCYSWILLELSLLIISANVTNWGYLQRTPSCYKEQFAASRAAQGARGRQVAPLPALPAPWPGMGTWGGGWACTPARQHRGCSGGTGCLWFHLRSAGRAARPQRQSSSMQEHRAREAQPRGWCYCNRTFGYMHNNDITGEGLLHLSVPLCVVALSNTYQIPL